MTINGSNAGDYLFSATGYYVKDINPLPVYGGTIPPGAYIEAKTNASVDRDYTYREIVRDCGGDCDLFYDPYSFVLPGQTGQGEDKPTWATVVWAAPIIVIYNTVTRQVAQSQSGQTMTAPGPRSIFRLRVSSFIPPAWIEGPPGDFCATVNGVQHHTVYGGDHRSFDPFSKRYRTDSEAVVSLATASAVTFTKGAGTTFRYADDAVPAFGSTLATDSVLGDCHFLDAIVPEDDSTMYNFTSAAGPAAVSSNFWGTGKDVATIAGDWAPPIAWNVTFTINAASNPYSPAYTYEYTHTCFPAHEAFIGSQLVYGYKPPSYSGSYITGCLSQAIPEIKGTTIGSVQ